MKIENQPVDYRSLILIVGGDDSNFKLIKTIIGKKCEVQWIRNGEEVVSLFLENRDKADAILMDVKMPVTSGLGATQRIRREGGTLPIIMQIAYAFPSDCENAMNVGASEVLVKLITLSILRNCLSSYLPQLVWQDSTGSTSSPGTCEQLPEFFFSVRTQTALSCEDSMKDSRKLMGDLNRASFFPVSEA